MDAWVAGRWESAITQLNPGYTLRILSDRLSANPKPCFYADIEGVATGPFDVVLDSKRDEPFLLGQLRQSGGKSYYDVWTSHRLPDSPVHSVAFHALHYSIEASISPDNSLEATAAVRLRAETETERILSFQLSRALTILSVTGEHDDPLAVFMFGEYARAAVASGANAVDMYANRQLEEDLRKRLSSPEPNILAPPSQVFDRPSTGHSVSLPPPPPGPADALKQLGKEID